MLLAFTVDSPLHFFLCCSVASRHRHLPLIHYFACFAGFKYLGLCVVCCGLWSVYRAQFLSHKQSSLQCHYLPTFDTVYRFANLCSTRKSFIQHFNCILVSFFLLLRLTLPTYHTMYNALIATFFLLSIFLFAFCRYLCRENTLFIFNRLHFYWNTSTIAHFAFVFFFLLPIWQNLKIITQTNWRGWRVILFFFLVTRLSVNKSLPKS